MSCSGPGLGIRVVRLDFGHKILSSSVLGPYSINLFLTRLNGRSLQSKVRHGARSMLLCAAGLETEQGVSMCRANPVWLPILLGGAKELGIVYMNISRGATEPRILQNHRRVGVLWKE